MDWRGLLGEVLQVAGPIGDRMTMQTLTPQAAWNHPDIKAMRQQLVSLLTEKHSVAELVNAGQELRRQHAALLAKKDLNIVELKQLGVLSGTAYVLTADALAQAASPIAIFQYTINEMLPWLRRAANVALIVANVATGGAAGQLLGNLHFGISSSGEPSMSHTATPSPQEQMLWKLIESQWTLARLLEQQMGAPDAQRTAAGPVHPTHSDSHVTSFSPSAALDDPPMEATDYSLRVGSAELREEESYVPSFDVVPAGKVGAEIVHVAQVELARPVVELYENGNPTNVDSGGHIKKYFLEGPRWKAETWDSYKAKHGAGPAWCAAFASYCWRTAHRTLSVELPLSLNAQCSALWEQAKKTGRFIDKTGTPSPGDIVFLGSGPTPGHVGVVERKGDDGIIYIIEGNAGEKTDQLCRSRLIPGKPRYAKLMGFASVDAPAAGSSASGQEQAT